MPTSKGIKRISIKPKITNQSMSYQYLYMETCVSSRNISNHKKFKQLDTMMIASGEINVTVETSSRTDTGKEI